MSFEDLQNEEYNVLGHDKLILTFDTFLRCVSEISEAAGQGYCQGGFSADFTTVTTARPPQVFSFLLTLVLTKVLSPRMVKWCWVDLAASTGKVLAPLL